MFRLPNTDPSRTNDHPVLFTGSAHDQPFPSFSLIPLRETARSRCTLCQGLSGSLPPSPPTSHPILRSRPDQPFLSEIFRRPRACTSLHLTSWTSPRPRKRAGQSRGTCSTLPLVPFFSDLAAGETGETEDLFIMLANKQAPLEEKGVTPSLFSSFDHWICVDDRERNFHRMQLSTSHFAVYRCER